MKIISNFTDYYDNVQQYGRDESIVFTRINPHQINFDTNQWRAGGLDNELKNEALNTQLKKSNFDNFFGKEPVMNVLGSYFEKMKQKNTMSKEDYILQSVITVINGVPFKSYMILEWKQDDKASLDQFTKLNYYKIIKKNVTEEDCFNYLIQNKEKITKGYISKDISSFKNFNDFKKYAEKKRFYYNNKIFKDNNVMSQESLLNIHKEISNPIFYIIDNKIVTNIPLVYFGATQMFENVEHLYQEISYCIGNVINNKNEPPQDISNEMKIEQHGFDKKISFRKR